MPLPLHNKSGHNFRIPYAPYTFRVRIKIRVRIMIRVRVRIKVRDRVRD